MDAEVEEAKRKAVSAFSEKLRTTILGKNENEAEEVELSTIWKAAEIQKTLATKKANTHRSPPHPTASGTKDSSKLPDNTLEDIDSFVDQIYQEASEALGSTGALKEEQGATATKDVQFQDQVEIKEEGGEGEMKEKASKSTPGNINKSKRSPVKGRPAWALSQDQAEALDDEEEKELLGFIGGLDFDHFVSKLDEVGLQEALKSLEEKESQQQGGDEKAWRESFVTALNRAAYKQVSSSKAQADEDGAESMAGTHISRISHTSRMRTEATMNKIQSAKGGASGEDAAAQGGWDARSTAAGDERTDAAAQRGLRDAEEFLLQHPELKTVHSNASVRAMIQKLEADLRSHPHLPK